MRQSILVTVLSLIAFVITSCSAIYENGEELATCIQSNINEITVNDLKSKIENGDDFLLIDVRQENEYQNASIPGALNIPRGLLEFKIRDDDFWEEEFLYTPENDAEIIVYCKLGYRGALSTLALQQLGFINVKNLHGGLLSWDPDLVSNTQKKAGSGGCGD